MPSPEPVLPAELLTLIREHTGEVISAVPTGGHSSAHTAQVITKTGQCWVKAVPNRPGGRRESLVREGLINPHVPVSPGLAWQAESADWIALGFEVIGGRPADFAPGSPDLPTVVDLTRQIGDIGLPEVARDWPETRFDQYAPAGDARLFAGETLLFTDFNPRNFLIGDGQAWVVDWSWPTRGAAFIDPVCLIVQLVAAGYSPTAAEAWASELPAWRAADPAGIDAFGRAKQRMHRTFAERNPAATWLTSMATATTQWLEHHRAATGRRGAA